MFVCSLCSVGANTAFLASWLGRDNDVVAIRLIGSINEPKAIEIGFYHRKFSLIVQRRL